MKRLPVFSIIKRNIHPRFCSGVKESFSFRIFPYHAGKCIIWNSLGYHFPGFTIIVCFEKIRFKIIGLIARHSHVGCGRVMSRLINGIHHTPFGHIFRCNVGPGLAAIFGNMNAPIIGADPNHTFFLW